MTYVRTEPIIRPVYLIVTEVPDPTTSPIDFTRSDTYTAIGIHPTVDPASAIQEIAQHIHDGEVRPWLGPWLGNIISLTDVLARLEDHFTRPVLHTPVPQLHVPAPQQAPWVTYL
ncbi:hypothetical protein [Nocardiopsis sp. NRRL B-16309]|uniref:hypothetical protein n=1 Tax=Nocardiopsis sp. NRRL B-16309 TaxID=1519494 RepID=UPI0006AEA10D|nr:hypothetical protein [Nocardiopsis sp. NRRL B-16309]KOX10198.1 hypothetical protein ADL05_26360 [Nocardiopsis sp. NRRL B-16309]